MRNKKPAALVTMALLYSTAGCQSGFLQPDRPARIFEPTPESRAALQDVMNRAVGRTVRLADDAFTDKSVLVIENNPPPTMEDPVRVGRVMEPPLRFRLVIDDTGCFVVDERDESRYLLLATQCIEY